MLKNILLMAVVAATTASCIVNADVIVPPNEDALAVAPLCNSSGSITCEVQDRQTVAAVTVDGKTYKYRLEPLETAKKEKKTFNITLECDYNFSSSYHGPIGWEKGDTCASQGLMLDQFSFVVKEGDSVVLEKQLELVGKDKLYFTVEVALEWDEGKPYPFTFLIKKNGTKSEDNISIEKYQDNFYIQIDQFDADSIHARVED